MRNSFIVNISLLILINVLIKPAYIFFVEIPVQNAVGHEAYGMYFTFLNLVYIFQLLTDLGTYNFTLSELPKERERFAYYFSNIATTRLVLGGVFFLTMVGVGFLFGYWQEDPLLFSIIVFNILLVTSMQYIRGNIAGLGQYFIDTWLSALDKVLMLGILVYLLYIQKGSTITIYGFAWAQMAAYGIALFVALAVLSRHISWERPSLQAIRTLMKRAIPYAGLIALMALSTRIDPIMIERIMVDGFEQAGLYASAYRLFDAMTMLTVLFGALLLPMFAELYDRREGRTVLFYGAFRLLTGLSVVLALTVIVLRDEVMTIYDETTTSAIQTLGILCIAFVAKGSLYVTSTLLTAHRAFRSLYVVFLSAIACNFLLNLVLIPRYGIVGAAVSTMATQVLSAFACAWACHFLGFVRFDAKQYLKICLFAILSVLAFMGLQRWSPAMTWVSVLALACALGVVFLIVNRSLITQLSKRLVRH